MSSRPSNGLLGLFLLGLLHASSSVAAASAFPKSDNAVRSEFIEAMQQVEEERQENESHRSLQEQLFQIARKVTGSSSNSNDATDKDRNLSERNLNYAYGQNGQFYRYNINNDSGERALDLTQYALKYVGCQNIHTWSDTRAEDENNEYTSPLAMEKFVVLRLCERESCSTYNKWGCNYEYGEFLLPMEEYLSIMATYHFQQFKQYCEVCYDCMHYGSTDASTGDDMYANAAAAGDDSYQNPYATDDDYYNGNVADDDTDDAAADAGDDYYQDDSYVDDDGGYGRRMEDNGYGYNANANGYNANDDNGGNYNNNGNANYNSAPPWYIASDAQTCLFESVCQNYKSACKAYSQKTRVYEDYFTCSEFNVGNNVGYLGPHCRSDGYTIGIGIYKDATCSSYIGDQVNMQQFTGQTFDDKELKLYYDKNCISCKASESYSLYTDDSYGDMVYPVCNELYDTAAQCNRHLSDLSGSENYESEQQEDTEDDVCGFVESLIENNYDEYGEIMQFDIDLAQWQNYQQYLNLARAVSPLQRLSILFFVGLSVVLLFYSCYLYGKLKERTLFEYPYDGDKRVNYMDSSAPSSLRVNSGIVMMRSRSPEQQRSTFDPTQTPGSFAHTGYA